MRPYLSKDIGETGPNIRGGDTMPPSARRSVPGAGFGPAAMLSRGSIAPVYEQMAGRQSAQTMRTRTH